MLEQKRKAPPNERQAKVLLMLAGSSMAQKDLVQSERRLARTQAVSQKVYGVESEEVSRLLSMRAMIAIDASRFDDAERFLKRGLEIQALCLGPDDAYVKAVRALMAGRYQDHINDRRVHGALASPGNTRRASPPAPSARGWSASSIIIVACCGGRTASCRQPPRKTSPISRKSGP